MSKTSQPKTAKVLQREKPMTDIGFCEEIRQALPEIAEPIRAGENVGSWIERVAHRTGLSAARLRAYWNYRVQAPKIHEYQAVMQAAHIAELRRQVIQEKEDEIAARIAELRALRSSVEGYSPFLALLLPPAPLETPPQEGETQVKP